MRALDSWEEAPGSQRHQPTMYNGISEVLSWDIKRAACLLAAVAAYVDWTELDWTGSG